MSETTTSPATTGGQADDLIMELEKGGRIVIRLRADLAPLAAERLRSLSAEGFYDNVVFHRVIEGFMAQGGDPTGTGSGGSKLPDLKSEFTTKAKFVRGAVGMARTAHPHSANSQFFIMFAPAPSLDGQYTIVGDVIEGMEHVDQIKRGAGSSGVVSGPDKIARIRPAASA